MNGVGGDHGYNENGVIQVSDFEYEQGGGLPAASIEPVFEGSVSTVEDRFNRGTDGAGMCRICASGCSIVDKGDNYVVLILADNEDSYAIAVPRWELFTSLVTPTPKCEL
ncbi:hypothetical protein Tco_0237485 [Tanacetum coccineum]